MDINLLFAMRAVMQRGYQPTTAQQERKARFTNPSPLVAQAEAVERRFCQQGGNRNSNIFTFAIDLFQTD